MKKIVSLLLAFAFLTSGVSAAKIYEYKEEIPVTNSVTLHNVTEFHSDLDFSYSVMTVDLSNKNTGLTLLTSDKGYDKKDTVKNLASGEKNIVGALNADFFSDFASDKSFTLGIEKVGDTIIQSPIYPDTMASVAYSGTDIVMGFLDFSMSLTLGDTTSTVRHLNKHTSYYGDILAYTHDFADGFSPAPGGDTVEVLTKDDEIIDIRRNMEKVEIPEGAYLFLVSESVNPIFLNAQIGDKISFDIDMDVNLEKAKIAFGAGGALVEKGKIVEGNHTVSTARNPRSAIGVSKDGETLYLVAVDGRQGTTPGALFPDLSRIMKEVGAYNAYNLDGGGSTYMVADTLYSEGLTAVNSPSETRKVINAVGITYEVKSLSKKVTGIDIKTSADEVFIGDSISVSAYPYNSQKLPTNTSVTFTSSNGTYKNGRFYAESSGDTKIKATSGGKSVTKDIYVVSEVAGIDIPSSLNLKLGEEKNLDVHVFDSLGHYVSVDNLAPFTIFSSNNSVVSVTGEKVVAKGLGTAVITVKSGNAVSYVAVTVGSLSAPYTESFEYDDTTMTTYPHDMPFGSLEVTEDGYKGKGIKITYDFTEEDDRAKGIYAELADRRVISSDTTEITLYAKGDNFTHTLKAELFDSKGGLYKAVFEGEITDEYSLLTAKVPKGYSGDLTLYNIYPAYAKGEEKDTGVVFIDEISFREKVPFDAPTIPQNEYSDILNQPGKADFAVGVMASGDTLISDLINSKMTKALESAASHKALGTSKFSTWKDKNALYFEVSTLSGGIRKSDKTAWDNIVKGISSYKGDNIFILTDGDIFSSDELENKVIRDYLSSLHQNVFVISRGKRNELKIINGVRYFTLTNKEVGTSLLSNTQNYSYLAFDLQGTPTYSFINLY